MATQVAARSGKMGPSGGGGAGILAVWMFCC
jgi:hypothetical protein